MGVDNQRQAPAALPPKTTRYSLYFRPGYVHKIKKENCCICYIIYNNTTNASFHITKNSIIQLIVSFLLRNFQVSEFYMPTFRNTPSLPSSYIPNILIPSQSSYLSAYEDETECSETSAYKNLDAGELPRKKHTTFRIRRKFESN
jgi:hypothetical protein